ncbi:MAG: hypothetical protein WAO71_03560 [Gallionella sp.]
MSDCITEGYVTVINLMLDNKLYDSLKNLLPVMARCGKAGGKVTVQEVADEVKVKTRAETWPAAIYYDKDGTQIEGSVSGLYKEVFGIPVTEELICRISDGIEKKDCRAKSSIENWLSRGVVVRGNGDSTPNIDPNISASAQERVWADWKTKIKDEGKKIHLYHPDSPMIKQATDIIKKTAKKKKGG